MIRIINNIGISNNTQVWCGDTLLPVLECKIDPICVGESLTATIKVYLSELDVLAIGRVEEVDVNNLKT